MSAPSITVHAYAAAKAALGATELTVPARSAVTIGDLLAHLADTLDRDGARVLDRCSYIVNGQATTDRSRPLAAGDRLDLLPPFAGG